MTASFRAPGGGWGLKLRLDIFDGNLPETRVSINATGAFIWPIPLHHAVHPAPSPCPSPHGGGEGIFSTVFYHTGVTDGVTGGLGTTGGDRNSKDQETGLS